MMTVGDLKAILENYPDDMKVFLSIDSEGNEYKQIAEVEDHDVYYVDEDYNEKTKSWAFENYDSDNEDEVVLMIWPV